MIYFMPTKVLLEDLSKIKTYVSMINPRKTLLVTGRSAMQKLGITDKLKSLLNPYKIKLFNEVEENPSITTVDKCVESAEECDLVIGLGGGSAIDVAKSAAILTKNSGSVKEYLQKNKTIKENGLPVIAIPTTSGTGSEVTKWASIWDKEEKKKYSLSDKKMYPLVAIVDPILTKTVPSKITASTGLDALSHAIEAYWSKNSNPISDIFAIESIKLVLENLEKAYKDNNNLTYKSKMSKASLFAGLAFSNTATTACHSVSYPMTAHFGVPHGLACAITLPLFLKFNAGYMSKEKLSELMKIFRANSVEEASNKIKQLIKNISLPTKLNELGINEEKLEIIVEQGFTPGKVENNPRKLSEEQLKNMLKEIL